MKSKTKISITTKYLIVGVIGLLAVVFAYTIINTNYQNQNLRSQHLIEAKNLVSLIGVSVAEDLRNENNEKLLEFIDFVEENQFIEEVIIFNTGKTNVIGSQLNEEINYKLNDPLMETTIHNNSLNHNLTEDEIILFAPVRLSNETIGGVKLTYSLKRLKKTEILVLFHNLKWAAIVFIIGLVVLYFFIKRTAKPIKSLIKVTELVSHGDYSEKIVIKTRDELETLADSFNEMVGNLRVSRDDILEAKENAEKSDRLKTEFLAQMSHEIRTPVNAIVNFTGLLKAEFQHKLYGEVKEAFDIIESSSERLIRTIDLIINMSELQSGSYKSDIEELHLEHDIIQPVLSEFKYKLDNKPIKILSENDLSDCKVHGDKYSLYQIFVNLIDNAIKYTEEGEIKIKLSRDDNLNPIAVVSDTGIGISDEFLPFLFEPFMQEQRGYSRKFEGTGLGLSLIKKYCDINNAEIKVVSKKNFGTTFTITFNKCIDNALVT